jgi:hypothetical protein
MKIKRKTHDEIFSLTVDTPTKRPITLRELSQLADLRSEIELDRQRLAELRAESLLPSANDMSGMPRNPNMRNRIEDLNVQILELERVIGEKQLWCIRERIRLEEFISEIDDSFTRQIFTLRFERNLEWDSVAAKLGGGNSADSIKMQCHRFLKKSQKNA